MNIQTMKFTVHNTEKGASHPQPVTIELPASWISPLVHGTSDDGQMFVVQRIVSQSTDNSSVYIGVFTPREGQSVQFEDTPVPEDSIDGPVIVEVPDTRERDAICRLNTGYFDLELCRGTGKGEGASKWGIRHFSSLAQNFDLLASGNNAIGGFYGPFFTPDNGLINPPEHVVADVTAVEIGPIVRRYRLSGRIPDGLLPELRGKSFAIDFTFYAGADCFDRIYHVDHFQTQVNGRSVTDRITVGDEFEGGQNALAFDRFDSFNRTPYRSGDPYAELLKQEVKRTISTDEPGNERFGYFQKLLNRDLENAHWDLYWRLFSYWEHALDEETLNEHLGHVRAVAHVVADKEDRVWQFPEAPVNVSQVDDQTIFAGPAQYSAEFNTGTGQCMIWLTSSPSSAFQIVQRPQSGWVNWGTNGENECPSLPVGSTVRSIYGPYADSWRDEALGHIPGAVRLEAS